jgi:hypothetical protein
LRGSTSTGGWSWSGRDRGVFATLGLTLLLLAACRFIIVCLGSIGSSWLWVRHVVIVKSEFAERGSSYVFGWVLKGFASVFWVVFGIEYVSLGS